MTLILVPPHTPSCCGQSKHPYTCALLIKHLWPRVTSFVLFFKFTCIKVSFNKFLIFNYVDVKIQAAKGTLIGRDCNILESADQPLLAEGNALELIPAQHLYSLLCDRLLQITSHIANVSNGNNMHHLKTEISVNSCLPWFLPFFVLHVSCINMAHKAV